MIGPMNTATRAVNEDRSAAMAVMESLSRFINYPSTIGILGSHVGERIDGGVDFPCYIVFRDEIDNMPIGLLDDDVENGAVGQALNRYPSVLLHASPLIRPC